MHYAELIGTWVKRNTLRHEAEDAAQDAMLKVLGRDPAAVMNPKAYLYRASTNHLLNEVRRQSRHDMLWLEDLADEEHPVVDPDAALRTRELVQALEAALASLPLKKRQAYIYHRLEGYTQVEVARKMGVALNTVERYIMDATREIREQLDSFCPK